VLKGLVANNNPDKAQLIRVSVSTADINTNAAEMKWYNVQPDGTIDEPFASATLYFGDAKEWLASWVPMKHLIESRVADLERLAENGVANRFNRNMAYRLFADSLVDYHSKYRGMSSVVLHELEAFADVVLTTEKGGSWTVPPYFIDSVAHLAGFIMNVSDGIDTKTNFCVTPGWRSMRFAKPLVAGAKYRSYVKMIPSADDPTTYFGDVYIMQDGVVMGMVDGIEFHRYPRILLSRFFSAPDDSKAPPVAQAAASSSSPAKAVPAVKYAVPMPKAAAAPATASKPVVASTPAPSPASAPAPVVAAAPGPAPAVEANDDTTTAKAIKIIAEEAALDLVDLTDDASFANLGVDSLMSLVIAEKFREQLGVVVSGSLFLEYPTIGDLRSWLTEYYN